MEYECPDPFPDIRFCPSGLKIDAAFCLLGYIHLHVVTSMHGGNMVFYYHPGYAGWNFVTPADLDAFWLFKERMLMLINNPQYGQGWAINYYKEKAVERSSFPVRSGHNLTYGVP